MNVYKNSISDENIISQRTFWLLRVIWYIALPGTAFLLLDLIYEMTLLTWARGPQMVGFTLAHQGSFGLFLLSFVLMALWVISILIWSMFILIRRRKVHRKLLFRALATLLFIVMFFVVPWENWGVKTMIYLHPGKPVPSGAAHLRGAAGKGDLGMIKFLLDHGVPVNARDKVLDRYYVTAVGAAADNVIPFLVEKGADINLADGHGRTPLMACAEANAVSKTRLLLKYGADTKLRDDRGETALDIAKRAANYQIIKLLDPNAKL